MAKLKRPNLRPKQRIDILFPPTTALPLAECGFQEPAIMARNQLEIARCLEKSKGLVTKVKPSAAYAPTIAGQVAMMSNVELLAPMPFEQCLDMYDVGLVIIDYPSTLLYEALPYDVEIAFLLDPVLPFEKQALELLKRRVHVCTTIDEMLTVIDRYRTSTIGRLRDPSFFNRHVYREDCLKRVRDALGCL